LGSCVSARVCSTVYSVHNLASGFPLFGWTLCGFLPLSNVYFVIQPLWLLASMLLLVILLLLASFLLQASLFLLASLLLKALSLLLYNICTVISVPPVAIVSLLLPACVLSLASFLLLLASEDNLLLLSILLKLMFLLPFRSLFPCCYWCTYVVSDIPAAAGALAVLASKLHASLLLLATLFLQ
jgi:hypothetical protein